MSLATTHTVTLTGVKGTVVKVEVDAADGLPGLRVVGLADTAINEARDRVRAAISNAEEKWKLRRITVNLSPASVRKRGTGFDLALACACLGAFDALPDDSLQGWVFIGELGLDGSVRPVAGILPMVLAAAEAGFAKVMVADSSGREAALVPGIEVSVVADLREVVAVLRELTPVRSQPETPTPDPDPAATDMAEVRGQVEPRFAVEVAAAGGHHLFLHGAPGAGKTLLAERLPGLLPLLDVDASMEVTAVHSVAGALRPECPLVLRPPFQAPHHTASAPALVGGGSGIARPGAISLAHRGVLFLDEAPEFAPQVLETLRQPMETGLVRLARSQAWVEYPAHFQLVMAANPCPCGRLTGRGIGCTCSPLQRMRYARRLSGPLMDRVDLQIPVQPVSRAELLDGRDGEPTRSIAERVKLARDRAARRFTNTPWRLNADVPGRELRHRFLVHPDAMSLVSEQVGAGRLSARGVDRVLRVSWTLADLAGIDRPGVCEVAGALSLRGGGLTWAA